MSHCPFVFAQGNTCGVPSFRVAERIELHKQHIGYVSTYRQKGYLRRRRLCQSDGLSSSRRSRRIFQRCAQILFACALCRFFALLRMTGLCQFCTLHFAFDCHPRGVAEGSFNGAYKFYLLVLFADSSLCSE